MRINLGCGADRRPGLLNIDARPLYPEGPDFLRCDLLDLDERLGDDSVNEIVACDVLEHVSWRELDAVLVLLARKLRRGGVLFVQRPTWDGSPPPTSPANCRTTPPNGCSTATKATRRTPTATSGGPKKRCDGWKWSA